jgi:hypothetical protein
MNKMPPQKVSFVEIRVKQRGISIGKYAVIAFGATAAIIQVANPSRHKNPIAIPNEILIPLFIVFLVSALVAFYFFAVHKDYVETGFIVIDDNNIEVYENHTFKETILRTGMKDIKLGLLESISDKGVPELSPLSRLNFTYNQKPIVFNLLFDRKQRMDEFYTRFNIPAPTIMLP